MTDRKAEALKFANQLRKREGYAPLAELPKGKIGSSVECSLARALPGIGSQAGTCTVELGPPILDVITLPPAVSTFVAAFDNGAYPELVDDR